MNKKERGAPNLWMTPLIENGGTRTGTANAWRVFDVDWGSFLIWVDDSLRGFRWFDWPKPHYLSSGNAQGLLSPLSVFLALVNWIEPQRTRRNTEEKDRLEVNANSIACWHFKVLERVRSIFWFGSVADLVGWIWGERAEGVPVFAPGCDHFENKQIKRNIRRAKNARQKNLESHRR